MPKLSQNDDTDNIATFPRPKCPANLDVKNLTYVKNLSFGSVCSIFEVPCTEDEGIDVPEIICEVCKDVPKYFQNVNHIEICIAFCKSCKDCKACEFCRSFRMIVFSCIRELPRPDEQAGADEKIAKIVEEMGFQKVDRQDNEDENLQEKVDHANEINAEFFNANNKVSWY